MGILCRGLIAVGCWICVVYLSQWLGVPSLEGRWAGAVGGDGEVHGREDGRSEVIRPGDSGIS